MIAKFFVASIKIANRTPNKTRDTNGVPSLLFVCPDEFHATFGLILSIAAIHFGEDGPFVKRVNDVVTILLS